MKSFPLSRGEWLVRLDEGEEAVAALMLFVRTKRLRGATFYGQGSLKNPVLAYYDLKKKRYLERQFHGLYEAVGMTGNLAMLGGAPALHCHLVIGDRSLKTHAGHLVRGAAGGTLEVVLRTTRPLRRARDAQTGLNVIL
ncbi:MAG: hypothetical protein A2128_01610 [Candidatus Liptonbacteria bacterium GWC1_60_9]|uniref:PPC domain-containing protein n=3 Tax=Candidatus Liptoniibacteriota TaxID=1817909 RepID=A0A1G2CK76_9BACT|nr:MAG: hypothetical protein A2128_01610 [Candidatus Liptonbacteria bacterium GWC1_60_9]OGY99365.1 MAG: hypothetical protein A3E09_01795 [Candidatus Liptonbacteria bacterium RIFCSPHIGHO2_12_FULL_60_13]OGZ01806.1 MAG: hypothetical protein A3G64_00355 [Candidatus Liptonbacteria bacterium RIFCSPLOWO2_12_FULL_60_15]